MENRIKKQQIKLEPVRELIERSCQNDRRGREPRNLYAVSIYNRRNNDRRKLDL